ncbi:MAG: ATP-binding cassette domain-containing protein [Phycisphaerales bacterium]
MPTDQQPEAPPRPLLDVRDLRVHFHPRTPLFSKTPDPVRAVDGVSFHIAQGQTLGLVGESGSGKTTVGRAVLRLIPAISAHISGHVMFDEHDVLAAHADELHHMRRDMQIIFQDPAGSLNPRMRVWRIVAEPLFVHKIATDADELRSRAIQLLERCGMPASAADRYSHQFSGGQRQRIGIARALALDPKFIVCDEPTSALDVSIQSQIINLLSDLQRDLSLTYLFISHDMAVVSHTCQRIAVMLRGKIVEQGPREQIIEDPQHEYTRELLSAVPSV